MKRLILLTLSCCSAFAFSDELNLNQISALNPDVKIIMTANPRLEIGNTKSWAVEMVREDLQRRGLSKPLKKGLAVIDSNGCAAKHYNVSVFVADKIKDSQDRPDLEKHAVAGSIIGIGAAVATERMICQRMSFEMASYISNMVGFLAACSGGVGKEVYDKVSNRGTPDTQDAFVTCLGGAVTFVPVLNYRF